MLLLLNPGMSSETKFKDNMQDVLRKIAPS